MLNMNGLWPQMTADSADTDSAADVWGLGQVFETQARLWNHMLDANKSLWELYMPWLAVGPSAWTGPFMPLQPVVERAEPGDLTGDNGVSEAMEAQARSWNQFVDVNRTFWAAFGWPAVLGNGAVPGPSGGDAGDRPAPRRTPARKPTRPGRSA